MTTVERKLVTAVERLSRALRSARQAVATDHGLSLLQLQIIEHVDDHPPSRVGVLADELDVTQPTISDALASLAMKSIVDRTPDPEDRRASLIVLTKAGKTLAAKIATQLEPMHEGERMTSPDTSGVALHVLLGEIRRLQQIGVISINRSCLSCDHYKPPKGKQAARCLLLDETLTPQDLRVDCREHSTT